MLVAHLQLQGLHHFAIARVLQERYHAALGALPVGLERQGLHHDFIANAQRPSPFAHYVVVEQLHAGIFAGGHGRPKIVFIQRKVQR